MGADSKIEWTHHTFNTHWGCARVSPACENCYAETFAKRVGHGKRLPQIWGVNAERKFFGPKHWAEPLKWNAKAASAGVRARVFCSSMADVFEDRRDLDAVRADLWRLMLETPSLDWLLLTKRPQHAQELATFAWGEVFGYPARSKSTPWLANVWLGTTVENQKYAEARIPILLDIPARVRFLSCEPLLEEVYLGRALMPGGVDCVICGGESGSGSRPMDPNWARALRDQCVSSGVAFHFKQWGGRNKKAAGRELDGRTWDEFPRGAA